MDEEEFVLSRKYNGKITNEQNFTGTELKKGIVEALVYARLKDSRSDSQAKYNSALQKINQVVWGKDYFPSKEAEKRRYKK